MDVALKGFGETKWCMVGQGNFFFSLDTNQVLMLPFKLVDLGGEENSIFEKCLKCKC